MKKADKYLIIGILCLALISFVIIQFFVKQTGSEVVIKKEKQVYMTVSLEKDQEVLIRDEEGNIENILTIQDGYAKMTDSTCPDHLCEKQKKIKNQGETIICLPHKVIIEVSGQGEQEFDALVK